ncbi:22936_t:CDS:2 [Gigaspora margarita]|uniref:22936_t:CDS:1 n=1 Tax=Gigaspora margarita TaxID=4874 RepID=A0ABM8VZH2_GIGMA|nr:22936_t:CDS:2 [Gigaspora margarita]
MANNLESGDNLVPNSLRTKFNFTPRQSLSINNTQSTASLKKQQDQKIQLTADLSDLSAALSKQHLELEKQLKELDKKSPKELIVKLTDLEEECGDININSTNSTRVFSGPKKGPNTFVPTMPIVETSSTSTATSSGKSSRRDRNAARGRQKDIEFATEIGQGLLVEVRRLQALVQEKEERINELEAEKIEFERNIEQLNETLRANQESEDRLNERVWTLELTKQDLNIQLEDLQQQLNKARSNYSKVEKALSTSTDVIEQIKNNEEKLSSNLENLKSLYEDDMENNRKIIDELKSQLNSFLNTSTSNGDNNDSNKNLFDENETIKALDVANRMISSLRASLKKEKDENHKLKMLLVDSQEFEVMHNTECFDAIPKHVKTIQDGSSRTSELSDIDGNKNNDI